MGAVIPMPSAPTSLLASPGYGVVTLSWAAPNANVFIPITSYNVYRAVDNVSGSYSLIASSSKLNYTDSGLASGPIYFYKVSAIIAAGESVQSLPASAHVTQSPIATTDNTTLILIVCGIVIALALIIGVILAKTSKRTRQRDKFVKPIYVAALGRCPICGKAVLTDMKHCANCGWTVDANLLLPLTKK
jgi:hypothetical protein